LKKYALSNPEVPEFVRGAVRSIHAPGSVMPSPAALKGDILRWADVYSEAVGGYDGPWDRLTADVQMINGDGCTVDTSQSDVWLLTYNEGPNPRLYVIAPADGNIPFRVAMFPQVVGGQTVLRDLPPRVGDPRLCALFDAPDVDSIANDPRFAGMTKEALEAEKARISERMHVRTAPDGTTTHRWAVVRSANRGWEAFCSLLYSTLASLGEASPVPQAMLTPRFSGSNRSARRLSAISGSAVEAPTPEILV